MCQWGLYLEQILYLYNKSLYKSDLIKSERPESDMSSESGILADHLNEDNLNDDQITEDDPKQNSSSPELLLEAIRRIGRDKLRNIMLDLSFGSKSAQIRPFFYQFGPFRFKTGHFWSKNGQKENIFRPFVPKTTVLATFRSKIDQNRTFRP